MRSYLAQKGALQCYYLGRILGKKVGDSDCSTIGNLQSFALDALEMSETVHKDR
ncbi:MAG: hypothetical protein ACLQO6_13860 [Desulfomonilaceae bacterium]